ncbi:uncharacterized protein LOC111018892 [Momordica charantia]|uniref:Uncharacterized protein LOC111018892 n=1 Tax=Momordica charantia TaxID=3673 RepID=A0A6J1D9L6_MOMCH|nr:uncharacterized protein LOC111018892 [Momordica charantia]
MFLSFTFQFPRVSFFRSSVFAMTSSSTNTKKDLHSPIFLLSNICNLVSIRLDSTDFILWKFQLTAILKAHKLFGFIDGSVSAPSQFLASSSETESQPTTTTSLPVINPHFEDWIAKDQALMTLINATLSAEALAYVVRSGTSKQVWEVLEKHYSSNSRTNVVNLKSDLQSIVKKTEESIDAYVKRIKEIKDKFANVSITINDEYLLIYALNGLSTEYNTLSTSMRTRAQSVSFEELHVFMKSEESAIEKQMKREDLVTQPNALFASSPQSQNRTSAFHPNQSHDRGRGKNNGRGKANFAPTFTNQGRGRSSGNFFTSFQADNRSPCQICGKLGHTALDCYNRMNFHFQGRHPPPQLAAMVAVQNNSYLAVGNSSPTTWLADSECNTHMTADLSNLSIASIASDYNGEENISVGSGQSFPITHFGCGQVFGSNYVPQA